MNLRKQSQGGMVQDQAVPGRHGAGPGKLLGLLSLHLIRDTPPRTTEQCVLLACVELHDINTGKQTHCKRSLKVAGGGTLR